MRQKRLNGKYKRLEGLIVLWRVGGRIALDNSAMDGDPKYFFAVGEKGGSKAVIICFLGTIGAKE